MGYSRKNPHPHDGRHGFLTPIQLDSGFLIEGGTRRFITTYFGIYSHLLCVSVAFLCFVLFLLQVCLSCSESLFCFLYDCDPNKTGSINAILLESRPSRWNIVMSPYVPKWRPSIADLTENSKTYCHSTLIKIWQGQFWCCNTF